MKKNTHTVSQTSNGEWKIQKNGSSRGVIKASTKNDAVLIGKVISRRSRSNLIVLNTVEKTS